MAANVIITPTTVPSSPRNGPPAIAMVSSTIWFCSRCVMRVMRRIHGGADGFDGSAASAPLARAAPADLPSRRVSISRMPW